MKRQKEVYDFVAVGAGVSGLTAAYKLTKEEKKGLVIEKNSRVGGRAITKNFDSIPFDLGASFLTSFYKNTLDLIRELDLKIYEIDYNTIAVARDQKIHLINSSSPLSFIKSPLLTFGVKTKLGLIALKALLRSPFLDLNDLKPNQSDESVQNYFTPAGQEAIDYLLNPVCNSLFFYDSDKFSQTLLTATLKHALSIKILNIDGGIDSLAKTLAKNLDIRLNKEVKNITKSGILYSVTTSTGETLTTKRVILSTPAPITQQLTKQFDISAPMINYSQTLILICKSPIPLIEKATVVWFPEVQNKHLVAYKVNTTPEAKQARGHYFQLNLRYDNVKDLDIEQIMTATREDLSKFPEVNKEALEQIEILGTHHWQTALPEMNPGYLERLEEMKTSLKRVEGLYIAGDFTTHPSVEGAVISGARAAEAI